jgi:hypothetical protein
VIGNVFLTIDPLNGQAQVGERVTITGYRAGGNAPITISWAGPPGSSAPLDSTERSISWIVQEGDSGTYTVTASSPGAPDDPQSAGITLTVLKGYAFLMESSGFILLEDGSSHILLET